MSTSLGPTTNNYNFVLESRDARAQHVQFRASIMSLSASEITRSSISCSWSLIRERFPSEIASRYVGFLLKGTILARKHVLALFSHFFCLVPFHVDVRCGIIFAFFRVYDEQISKPISLRVQYISNGSCGNNLGLSNGVPNPLA